ncbi:Uncharacterised protein [Vibrio cholerae]|nr:Uncharacterised protein [Vibrio cholerae]
MCADQAKRFPPRADDGAAALKCDALGTRSACYPAVVTAAHSVCRAARQPLANRVTPLANAPPAAHVQRLEFAEWAVHRAYSVCNHDYRAANNTLFLAAEYRAQSVDKTRVCGLVKYPRWRE